MTKLHERQVVQLLLVRAVEEHDPSLFAPEVLSNAVLAAIDARDEVELLEKRTAYLSLRLPKVMKSWAHVALLPEDWLGSWLLVAALVGMLSNYLGPSGLVHVVYNPLTFLLVWNLAIYAVLAWRRLRPFTPGTAALVESSPLSHTVSQPHESTNPQETSNSGGLCRWLLGDLYLKWLSYKAKYQGARVKLANAGKVGAAFWESYWDAAGSVIVARLETLVHIGAIGVLFGALAGTYLRGFFFEYNAIWRSTFLTDPTSVTAFLNFLLGPASLLIDGRLLTPEAVHPLLLPSGTLAGPWIHKLALTAGLVVLAPRAILATLSARHARTEARSLQLDLSEAYCAEKISTAREGHTHRIRDGIATTFRLEVGKLAESVALFVRERFFDKIVAPTLVTFRNRGGRIKDLEAELSDSTAKFESTLSDHLRTAQQELQQSLGAGIQSVIGRELHHTPSALGAVSPGSLRLEQKLTGLVATNVGDTIGATVTAAVAAAVATISGGIGKTLGIAILSSLLGTSGPIGLLIGGIVALAVVGGAYLLGRDRVTEAVKGWRIPASVVSLALRDSKIEQAREATYAQVRQEIQSRLDPQISEVTETILQQMSLAVIKAAQEGAA
jgi:hypothetical protein